MPLDDKGDRWREVSAEEFIPDTEAAIMELIGANDLLEKAGAEVTAVSGLEPQREEVARKRLASRGYKIAHA